MFQHLGYPLGGWPLHRWYTLNVKFLLCVWVAYLDAEDEIPCVGMSEHDSHFLARMRIDPTMYRCKVNLKLLGGKRNGSTQNRKAINLFLFEADSFSSCIY
jgi:hypothetical protein